jgi:hypothetical protein
MSVIKPRNNEFLKMRPKVMFCIAFWACLTTLAYTIEVKNVKQAMAEP